MSRPSDGLVPDDPGARRLILGTALLPRGRLESAIVEVADGRIATVEPADAAFVRAARREPGTRELAQDTVLAPAFIDVHCHGAGGGSAHGDEASLRLMARTLHAHGVGAFLATTVTAPLPEVLGVAARVGRLAADRQRGEALMLGVHLEGPALSPARSAGHDQAALEPPAALLASLGADPQAWRHVRAVTLAPELDGGLDLVAALANAGIVASIGHTDADAEGVLAAYAVGARSTTHLFNGMPPLGHHAPGPVGAALGGAPFVELLCDGVHVEALLLSALARAIGRDRLLLVSDALPLAGSRRRTMDFAGARIRVRGGRALDAQGTLAGSLHLLDGMVASAVHHGIPLEVALRAASENPARLLGLDDRGHIEPGAVADLVVVGRDGRLRRVLGGA